MRYLYFLLLFSVSVGFIACDDDDDGGPVPTFEDVQLCHLNATWDSLTLRNNLVGTWDQRAAYNPWVNQVTEIRPDSNVVKLFSNGEAEVKMGSVTYSDLEWSIHPQVIETYRIEIRSNDYSLTGALSSCNNSMIIGNSFVDGIDMLFVRKD